MENQAWGEGDGKQLFTFVCLLVQGISSNMTAAWVSSLQIVRVFGADENPTVRKEYKQKNLVAKCRTESETCGCYGVED